MSLEFTTITPDTVVIDDLGTVVAAMRSRFILADSGYILASSGRVTADGGGAPFYMYDHPVVMNQRLLAKDKDKVLKYQKYPLVALRLPSIEDNKGDAVTELSLNIALMAYTAKDYNTEQRKELVFKTLLIPMYELFFEALRGSGLFTWANFQEKPPHRRVDRYYWSADETGGKTKSMFTDPLDAIEILDLKIFNNQKKLE